LNHPSGPPFGRYIETPCTASGTLKVANSWFVTTTRPLRMTSGSNSFTPLGSGGPNLNIENTFQASDNLMWNRGTHIFKMGGDARRRRFDTVYGGGQTVFGSIFSSSSNDAGSGSPLADFLLGYPAQLTGTQLPDWARLRDLYGGAYVQDDWKLNSPPHAEPRTALRIVLAASGRP
jgi:hypothetical protein